MSKVAPELRNMTRLAAIVPKLIGRSWGRRLIHRVFRNARPRPYPGVTVKAHPELRPDLWVYTPDERKSDAALLWIHGGGFLIGHPIQDDHTCVTVARKLGIVVVSVDYRLAPEHPFPAAHDDCYAAWQWMQRSAEMLQIDPERIAIGGQSAGGSLAASLIQKLQDQDAIKPIAQWLFCPMLDDRTAADRELDAIGHKVWNNRLNALGWQAYLGAEPGAEAPPAYAVPGRRTDFRGFPPAWIGVGDIDLFLEEDQAYAEAMRASGVDVAMTIVPNAPHGFEAWAARTSIAKAFLHDAIDWLGARLRSHEAHTKK